MKLRDFLEKWGMTSLKIKTGVLDATFEPQDPDRDAAWDLYIELLTRVSTQRLKPEHGDERTALDSVHQLFPLTREIIRKHGRGCTEFTKIAIIVLNQVVRPFTAKWHRASLEGAFDDPEKRKAFREELRILQSRLRRYTQLLSDMAGVEDWTDLEDGRD